MDLTSCGTKHSEIPNIMWSYILHAAVVRQCKNQWTEEQQLTNSAMSWVPQSGIRVREGYWSWRRGKQHQKGDQRSETYLDRSQESCQWSFTMETTRHRDGRHWRL